MRKATLILYIFVVLFEGCSVSRKALSKVPVNGIFKSESDFLGEVKANNISKSDFSIQKASISFTDKNITTRFIAGVRYRLPDSLIISVRTPIGTEAARLFMTDDTVIINDRLNKRIICGSPENAGLRFGVTPELIFLAMGDFISDREVGPADTGCKEGKYVNKFEAGNKVLQYSIDCRRKKVIETFYEGDIRTGEVKIGFGKFFKVGSTTVPGVVELTYEQNGISIRMMIEKVVTDWKGKMDFKTGSGYKIVHL